jgi:hypothetical protein
MVEGILAPNEFAVQPIPRWGSAGNSILRAHLGTIEYQQAPLPEATAGNTLSYRTNEKVWRDVIGEAIIAGQEITLEGFDILDWFPRAPGLYYTQGAPQARDEAFGHLHPKLMDGPALDHVGRVGKAGSLRNYTAVFTPEGKSSMLEGGVGCIRLRPIRIDGKSHWLKTATSDGVIHTGVPIALPQALYNDIHVPVREQGAIRADIFGEIAFLDDPVSRVFDAYAKVPKVYLRVTSLRMCEPGPMRPLNASVAVSFVSEYQGAPKVYATYVTFEPNRPGTFDAAVTWMKQEYIEGQYRGRIITDFDQTRNIFPEARLALSKVLDREVTRGVLRETIELMHSTASIDAYLTAADRQDLLAGRNIPKTRIFISYAHAPERETKWVSRIQAHLSGLAMGWQWIPGPTQGSNRDNDGRTKSTKRSAKPRSLFWY